MHVYSTLYFSALAIKINDACYVDVDKTNIKNQVRIATVGAQQPQAGIPGYLKSILCRHQYVRVPAPRLLFIISVK